MAVYHRQAALFCERCYRPARSWSAHAVHVIGKGLFRGEPRTRRQLPTVEVGQQVVSDLLPHQRRTIAVDPVGAVTPEPDGRLFRGPKGATPRRNNFNGVWKAAVKAAGANPELHLHDLRHAGATLTAQTGATLKEIMSRVGHASTRAALIYQHATSKRDHEIAVALDTLIRDARKAAQEETDDTEGLSNRSE